MVGQWIGRYKGTNSGLAVVELDDVANEYRGVAQLFDDDPSRPLSVANIPVMPKTGLSSMTVEIFYINRSNQNFITISKLKELAPHLAFPERASLKSEWSDTELRISWQTSVGSHGQSTLRRSRVTDKSKYRPNKKVSNWEKFKGFASSLERGRYIFRGQSTGSRLRTTFHRTGRSNLAKYITEDIPEVFRYLSSSTNYLLDINKDKGTVYSLLQHHGYPTPLLDWTYSPYIAAYFAFRRVSHSIDEPARIFVFDSQNWRKDFNQLDNVTFVPPHLSIIPLMPAWNSRMIPQQAISTLTNVEDIESYIREREKERGAIYLTVVDLPKKERILALEDLSKMGIGAGSLFPGLDGTCEDLKNRFFGF